MVDLRHLQLQRKPAVVQWLWNKERNSDTSRGFDFLISFLFQVCGSGGFLGCGVPQENEPHFYFFH